MSVGSSVIDALPNPVSDRWALDASVRKSLYVGDTLYVGGAFWTVSPNTGGWARLSSQSTEQISATRVAGVVYETVSDGEGGWFIAGAFQAMDGEPRHDLARLDAEGQLAPWDAGLDGGFVEAIAVAGSILYIGGSFSRVGDAHRDEVAAIDIRTAAATDWNPGTDDHVYSMTHARGTLYIGGEFRLVGGKPRRGAAAIDMASGRVLDWNPELNESAIVYALLEHGNEIFIGGRFQRVAERSSPMLTAVDLRSGASRPSFTPVGEGPPNTGVYALAVHGNLLYVGGAFYRIGGEDRPGFAALQLKDGRATEVFPLSLTRASHVYSIAVHAGRIFLGGWVTPPEGKQRGLTSIDLAQGTLEDWAPEVNNAVVCVVPFGRDVMVGGVFNSIGPAFSRRTLAAFNRTTGDLLDWDPRLNGDIVLDLAERNGVLYAAGNFSMVGGSRRVAIAGIDRWTGLATSWNPDADRAVHCLEMGRDVIYAGGEFERIGGQARMHLAAIDLATGTATPWNPDVNGTVRGVCTVDTTLYFVGLFNRVGGTSPGWVFRTNAGAVSLLTGRHTRWDPRPTGFANKIARVDHLIVLAGAFRLVGGTAQQSLACVDQDLGRLAPFQPEPLLTNALLGPQAHSLLVLDGALIVGGDFTLTGGQRWIAAFETDTWRTLDWKPDISGIVWSLTQDREGILVGGSFPRIGTAATYGFGFIPAPQGPEVLRAAPISMAPLGQSSVRVGRQPGSIQLRLEMPTRLEIELFDLTGRRIRLVPTTQYAAGVHSVVVADRQVPRGLYFYRVRGEGLWTSGKVLVTHQP